MQRGAVLHNLDTVRHERSVKTKDYVADLLSWDQYDTAMKQAVAPYLYQVIIETGRQAMLDLGISSQPFDPFTPSIRRYQDIRTTKIATGVNDETEKQLRASITEGVTAGESNYQIRARIEAVFGYASLERADLIASTEVTRAQAYGDIQAWGQSGVVTQKQWYTAKDERVCKFCGPMHLRIIQLEENFFDKGDVQIETGKNRKGEASTSTMNHSYDDVIGPPLHPRCRCTLLSIRQDI